MRYAAGIGPPDVVKATCPVRGALGGNPLSRGSTDAVLRLHSGHESVPDNQPCDLVSQRYIERFRKRFSVRACIRGCWYYLCCHAAAGALENCKVRLAIASNRAGGTQDSEVRRRLDHSRLWARSRCTEVL